MAKKVRTPEEVQARLEKKAAKRKLFFGTFTKALAFFLAIAMVYSLAIIAFTPATVAPTTGNNVQSGNTSNGFDDYDDGSSNAGTGDAGTNDAGNAGNAGNAGGSAANNSKNAEYVKLLNDATAKAASMGYNWERMAAFENPENPLQVLDKDGKDASDSLNSIIALVDDKATISGVVGGFLDIPQDGKPYTAKVAKGQTKDVEGMRGKEDKFLLKGAALTASDLAGDVAVNGNTYTFKLVNCKNPQKDSKNAIHHVTNDFITIGEVRDGVAGALGNFSSRLKINDSTVNYDSIVVVAVIENGALKSMKVDYRMDVTELNLVADLIITKIPMTGKGAGKISMTYNNFA